MYNDQLGRVQLSPSLQRLSDIMQSLNDDKCEEDCFETEVILTGFGAIAALEQDIMPKLPDGTAHKVGYIGSEVIFQIDWGSLYGPDCYWLEEGTMRRQSFLHIAVDPQDVYNQDERDTINNGVISLVDLHRWLKMFVEANR